MILGYQVMMLEIVLLVSMRTENSDRVYFFGGKTVQKRKKSIARGDTGSVRDGPDDTWEGFFRKKACSADIDKEKFAFTSLFSDQDVNFDCQKTERVYYFPG